MSFYSGVLETVFLPVGDLCLGTRFVKSLNEARRLDNMAEADFYVYQAERLGRILEVATQRSGYYKRLKIAKSDNSVEWLNRFPLLEKEHLRANTESILTCKKEGLICQKSSGSSGIQSTVYWDKGEWSEIQAFQTHWWEWAGYRLGLPLLQTGMTTKRGVVKKVKDVLTRTDYFPAFAFSNEEALKTLKKQVCKNQYLGGYASSLFLLAKIALEENSTVRFTSAISWGDKLFEHYRTTIERAFRCKTYETYGTSEGFMIASQKDLQYLYINTPQVYLEILDNDGRPVPDGEMGNVVVTNLVNTAMPLIRYKIGDLAIKLPPTEYPKVREFAYPLLKKVVGRDTDIILTHSLKSLVVHTFTGIFEHYQEIKQFKVIQNKVGEIIIEYISETEDISDILMKINNELVSKTASEGELSINFKRVSSIAPTKSGKPQIIESRV